MDLRPVDNVIPLHSSPDASEVSDLLAHLVSEHAVARCVVIYEDSDGDVGWLATDFGSVSEQIGFVELAKLQMYHVVSHDV